MIKERIGRDGSVSYDVIDLMNVDPLNICSRYDEQRTDLPGDNATTSLRARILRSV
jgi:hypothetical protein